MSGPRNKRGQLTPELLLRAYAAGIFPMSESRDDPNIFWVDPQTRGVIPLDGFHVPRSLKRTVRRKPYRVTFDAAFGRVIAGCAGFAKGRPDTWINDEIRHAYTELHGLGFAHSVECWQDDVLVGGLYGVSLGGGFFGESMFSKAKDASKVALVHLVAQLRRGGFVLLDTQFVTGHLKQFGAEEIPARDYLKRLEAALGRQGVFDADLDGAELDKAVEEVLAGGSS